MMGPVAIASAVVVYTLCVVGIVFLFRAAKRVDERAEQILKKPR